MSKQNSKSRTKRKTDSSSKGREKISPEESRKNMLETWAPKTELGKKVKSKEITNIDELLNSGVTIFEPEIVDALLQVDSDLLLIGQSKGKFGGGQRRVFRQTQKKTREGNKPKFSTMCVVGDRDGHVGIGFGKAKETVPAREKSKRQAKINIFKIRRGCGSWQCNCGEPHTVPFEVEGKCGSVIVRLIPAPKGKGLCVESEIAKMLEYAGITDVWSKTFGQTKNRLNLFIAAERALRKLALTKVREVDAKNTYVVESSVNKKKKKEILTPKEIEEENLDEKPEREKKSSKKPKSKPKSKSKNTKK
jgi:small subunit ribosomal protein S5